MLIGLHTVAFVMERKIGIRHLGNIINFYVRCKIKNMDEKSVNWESKRVRDFKM